jgi:outer membrane receptor protein involved in Fe transport
MKNSHFRLKTILLASSALIFAHSVAAAQTNTTSDSNSSSSDTSKPTSTAPSTSQTFSDKLGGSAGLMMDTVVVTGNSQAIKKFNTPYSISTLNAEEIREEAPRSLVDLLRTQPGINAENSGGEGGGENIMIRGLPYAGFRLIDVQEDGLPLFESNYEREMNVDELYRVDLNTTRVEVVRGGTAPIFDNNASGGVVNLITNQGTSVPQGQMSITGGSHSLGRVDFNTSGPITDKLLYSVGGFYRRDDGQRNPGFPNADAGGQFKVAFTYKFSNSAKIFVDYKYLNDRTIFYTDIPLVNPVTGGSLSGLINPSTGTLDSASYKRVSILTLNGSGQVQTLNRDLADGIHPIVSTFTTGGDVDLGNGWKLTDKARYTTGTILFNGIFNGSPAAGSGLLTSNLAAAQAAFPGTTSLRYVYAGTNTAFDPATTGGLTMTNTWESVSIAFRDLINSLRTDKTFDFGGYGRNDVTLGVDVQDYKFSEFQLTGTIVTDVKNQPDLLDIQALNASGGVAGAVTNNGFSAFGSGDLIGNSHGVSTAVYGLDNWHITPAWQVDIGVRHDMEQSYGNRGLTGGQTIATTGPLATRTITGLLSFQPYSKFLDGTSWTAGTSYDYNRVANIFARVSSAYSFPRLSDQWGSLNNGVFGTLPNGRPIPTVRIGQAEGGIKFSIPTLQLSAIGFASHFIDLNASTYVTNAQGLLTNQSLLITTTTYGVEFEGAWKPVHWFALNSSATLQKANVDNASTFNTTISAASINGKEVTHAPPYTVTVQPTYLFDLGAYSGRAYAIVMTEGSRYQDYTNTSILPAYTTLDLGAALSAQNGWSLDVHALNITNSQGLTEGNARAPLSNVISTANATTGRPIFGRSFQVTLSKHW